LALTPGTRLGVYEITAKIGEGGMGQVYRARDTKLNRDVAMKVLPDSFASDTERLARFTREAQTLASLNHPNIAHIHGLEESSGACALVMELVEGDDVSQRIAQGAIPLDEAMPIAKQIAEALEAAHAQGIIHRDLKPANIKVRPDGQVKVLDFGLAKVLETERSPRDVSQSPTITSPAVTRAGVILGTAAYMSPEQARGRVVDRRADIWAFGCVLYEMLTGRRAFPGETVQDTLAAILERTPDWKSFSATERKGVGRVIQRCLQKDVKRRWHDIADVRIEIDDLLTGPSLESSQPHSFVPWRARLPWLVAVAATVAAIAATILAWEESRASSDADSLAGISMEQLTFDSGYATTPALSPDGRLMAYASDRAGRGDTDIWVQQTAGGVPLRLTDDPTDDSSPDFSPDSSQIVFRSERSGGGVYVMSALGGPSRLLANEGRSPRFSPDGSQVAYWRGGSRGGNIGGESAVFVLPLAGGAPRRLLSDFVVTHEAVWSPDGRSLVVLARRDLTSPLAEVYDWWWVPLDARPPVRTGVLDLPGLRAAQVVPRSWTQSGVVFSDSENLWSIAVSPATGLVTGAPRRLTAGVGGYEFPTVSRDGQIAFAMRSPRRVIERVSLNEPTAPASRLYIDGRSEQGRASGSRDGSVIVFEQSYPRYREIWFKDLRTNRQELVLRVDTPLLLNATVSPDGSRVAYTVPVEQGRLEGTGYTVDVSGGTPRVICEKCEVHGFLSDNRRVLAIQDDTHALVLYDVVSGSMENIVQVSEGRLGRPHASPDDEWLAYTWSREAGTETFLTVLNPRHAQSPDSSIEIDEPTTTGRPAGWALDSRVVYLLLDTDGFRCVWGQRIDPASGRPVGTPFAVRHFHSGTASNQGGFGTSFGDANTAKGFMYEDRTYVGNLWKLTLGKRSAP
jgi:serine/threonine protein kinase/Tol biopolymer transport system component